MICANCETLASQCEVGGFFQGIYQGCTALVDALEKTSHFTLGCKSLTIGTDHMPLLPIIHCTNLGEIRTQRQQTLKERLMRWNLTATYVPGKHLGGTDALSRAHNDDTVNDITWGEYTSAWG